MEFFTRHTRTLFLFASLLVGVIGISEAQKNDVLFKQGTKQYTAEQYQQSIDSWKLIEKTGNESAALYHNLGNAYYKINKVAPSIYYYEKALQLAPNDAAIKNNLGFAQNARVDAIEALPKNFVTKTYERLYSIATFETWAIIAVVLSMACVLAFLVYYFVESSAKKRLFLVTSIAGLILLFTSVALAYSTYNNVNKNQPAIIFAESVEIKTEANLGSETSFELHEGTKVDILMRQGDWCQIRIANGKEGWMPLETLKAL
jgi:tetratricopeptide (TPR) repeat protein